MTGARESWLAAHPYLAPIARFETIVREAALRVEPPRVEPPRWEPCADALARGVPLLRCGPAGPRLTSAAAYVLGQIVERAAETIPPGDTADALDDVRSELRRNPEERARVIDWTVGGAPRDPARAHAGLLKRLGWAAVSRVLSPVLEALSRRPDANGWERWGRGSCPTCGSLPALAHLARVGEARARFLVCACCRTRWPYARMGCPFCSSDAPERRRILEPEDGGPLRIDACDDCGGYVKTYVDDGEEELFLSDWSTLHFDVAARNHGFRRFGASLYALPDEREVPA